MRPNFTLPELQQSLDRLERGAVLKISNPDFERLFGINDVAVNRLLHFARGHDCIVSRGEDAIYFRKRIEQADRPPK
jgi:hypothetical protein